MAGHATGLPQRQGFECVAPLGKEAGVTLLVVLMALKTLELRARRDAMVIFFLGFFLVLTHCLYSQSLLMALHMALATWGLLTALVLANMPVGKPPLWRAARCWATCRWRCSIWRCRCWPVWR